MRVFSVISVFCFMALQVKVVEKYFSGYQMTADNLKVVNESLRHNLEFVRVSALVSKG